MGGAKVFLGRLLTKNNVDCNESNSDLTIGELERDINNANASNKDYSWNGYFYHKGPEFRIEYIYNRVEY